MVERLRVGDFVCTIQDAGRDDWQCDSRICCAWGVIGQILDISDAHGLCYFVRHGDGTCSWYDHDELKRWHPWRQQHVSEEPMKKNEHAWFRHFMGVPDGDGVSGGKSGLAMLLLFFGAMALVAWLMSGCQAIV